MKIYDCFTFYNEFDLLDLRIAEMYDHIDHMILVEANYTFQNQPKSLYFQERIEEYKHLDKIIHVIVEDMPLNDDPWINERHQRDCILRGLNEADEDDIIIIGDIDEILRPSTILKLREDSSQVYGFRIPLFNFKYNYMLVTKDCYSVWNGATKKSLLESPEDFRRQRHTLNDLSFDFKDDYVSIIEHAGWHFTYLGDNNFARNKIQSFAHADANTPEFLNQIDIEESIKLGRGIKLDNSEYLFQPVKLDDYLPSTIINNQNSYIDKLLEASTSAREYLPK